MTSGRILVLICYKENIKELLRLSVMNAISMECSFKAKLGTMSQAPQYRTKCECLSCVSWIQKLDQNMFFELHINILLRFGFHLRNWVITSMSCQLLFMNLNCLKEHFSNMKQVKNTIHLNSVAVLKVTYQD